jgi:biopolymer transport protein ExbD
MPLKLNQDEPPSINLTSMIDILFLLIIFFMVGTRFTENESNIQIHLPKVAPNGAIMTSPSGKIVYVQPDGSLVLDNQKLSSDQLTSALNQAVRNYPETSVQLKSDASATMQQTADAISAIRRSGAKFDGLTVASYQMPGTRR